MNMKTRPDEVSLNFNLQRRSNQFRRQAAEREVETCRAWFLKEGQVGCCLTRLCDYILATRMLRGRKEVDQPRYLTRLMVEAKVCHWLMEMTSIGSREEKIDFHEKRLQIARHAGNWAALHVSDRLDSKRFLAVRIVAIAKDAEKLHSGRILLLRMEGRACEFSELGSRQLVLF